MKYVKDSEWLLNHLNDVDVRIVDCRFSLADPQKGEINYRKNHLPGAVYFDLEKDLSGTVGDHGGRHPLPELDVLVKKLENAGISHEISVIAYDDGEGAFAARFWWLLQYLGHSNVYVLDGGFKNWLESDLPVTSDVPTFKREDFRLDLRLHLLSVQWLNVEQNSIQMHLLKV